MGSDLQLTGLASGFDWAPVVDQLIELERIPQKRLEQEKVKNEEKISDLGILKTQLDTLKGAVKALQNENLFQSRTVGMSSSNKSNASVSASAKSITGEFSVKVLSKATSSEMSSKTGFSAVSATRSVLVTTVLTHHLNLKTYRFKIK